MDTAAGQKSGEHYYLEKLYLTSNWNTRNNGFIEVYDLSVENGKREKPAEEAVALPKDSVYDARKWSVI